MVSSARSGLHLRVSRKVPNNLSTAKIKGKSKTGRSFTLPALNLSTARQIQFHCSAGAMKSSLNLNYAAQKENIPKSTRDLLELNTLSCNTTTPVCGSQLLRTTKQMEAPISLIGFCNLVFLSQTAKKEIKNFICSLGLREPQIKWIWEIEVNPLMPLFW